MTCTTNQMCQCGTYEYHYLSSLTCLPQQFFNGPCSVDFNCRGDKYLVCVNSACACISSYPVWSVGYYQCIVPKSYDQYCYANSDCNTALNLICHDGTQNCTCPTNVNNNYCDCLRLIGNETYWSGSSCVPALSYNQSCSSTSSSYMCKTLTEGTICSGSNPYKCSCPTLQYYNFTIKQCTSQLSNSISCSQTDACRTDLGLSCQSGVCQCNSTIQFWNGTKCINYYTYNGGSCTNSSQCNNAVTSLICRTSGTTCNCPTSIGNGLCDCPTRVANNEMYWNLTYCVTAGVHGSSCTSDYHCQQLTLTLECDTTKLKCVCNNSLWDSVLNVCVPCESGWFYHNEACYKSAWLAIADFKDLTISNIVSYCTNTATSNVSLTLGSDFTVADGSLIRNNICNTASSWQINYFGPVNSVSCPCFDCSNTGATAFTTHGCDHGQSHHAIICKYNY